MKNRTEPARFLPGMMVAFLLTCGIASAMPTPNRPTPTTSPGRRAAGQTNQPVPWLGNLNQGISGWLGQQVLARKTAAARLQPATKNLLHDAELQRLANVAGSPVKATFRRNGTPSELKGTMLEPALTGPTRLAADRYVETARGFLRASRKLLLLEDPDSELGLRTRESDQLGRQHLRFRQEY